MYNKVNIINPDDYSNSQKIRWPGLQMYQSRVKTNIPLYCSKHFQDEFPICLLPDSVAKVINELTLYTNASAHTVAQTVLSAIALSCQGIVNVKNGDEKTPVNEFFCTLIPSGNGKSKIDSLVFEPINTFQSELKSKNAELEKKYEEDLIYFKKTQAKIIKEKVHAKSENDKNLIECKLNNNKKPIKPKSIRWFLEDVTKAEIMQSLKDELPIKLIKTDEGEFAVEQTLRYMSFINKLFSCVPISVSTRRSGHLDSEDHRVSIHLMFQPESFRQVCESKDLISLNNGFIARFLFAFPNSESWASTVNPNHERPKSLETFHSRIILLLKETMELLKNPNGKSTSINLSDEALLELNKFKKFIDENMEKHKNLSIFDPIYRRVAEHAIRLAGLLHCFEHGAEGEITQSMMERCCALAMWYIQESIKVVQYFSKAKKDRDIETLLNYIRTSGANRQIQPCDFYNNTGYAHNSGYIYYLPNVLKKYCPYQLRHDRRLEQAIKELQRTNDVEMFTLPKNRKIIAFKTDLFSQSKCN